MDTRGAIRIRKARQLRRAMGHAETILWKALRRHGIGFHCRRQHAIGPYVLDFYIHEALLALEVDGDCHTLPEQAARDARRDEVLLAHGIETLRIPTPDLYSSLEAVMEVIYRRCCERSGRDPFPGPPP